MSLGIPNTIRMGQRGLYAKVKQEPALRFHALYDQVSRVDSCRDVLGVRRLQRLRRAAAQLREAQHAQTRPMRRIHLVVGQ